MSKCGDGGGDDRREIGRLTVEVQEEAGRRIR